MRFISPTVILFLCLSILQGQANLSNEERFALVDQLFEPYDRQNSPGYALGIIQNGQLIYAKGYGQANLDYNIPITSNSLFYIGSMAKQFTAAALLILEAEGKIDFDKPVKYYLPEFPEYKWPITIRHLIHHTSGIRGTNSLQLFQGIDLQFEAFFNTDDLSQLIMNQKELNFPPGQEYRYSSGCYAVLAKIVEQISGEPFRQFLDKKVFKPLGMYQTFVCDNHNEVIPNRTTSYWPNKEADWERRSVIFDAYGDGGIMTSVADLVQWDKAFYNDLLGVENFAQKMYTTGILNDGTPISYAFALNINEYKGQKCIYHNGGMLGYRVDMMRFPDQQFTVIALSNSAYSHPTRVAWKIADIFLTNMLVETTKPKTNLSIKKVNREIVNNNLARMAGTYWSDDFNHFRRLTCANDSLFWDSGDIANSMHLQPIGRKRFELGDFTPKIIVEVSPDFSTFSRTLAFSTKKKVYRKFDPIPPQNLEELSKFVGKFYSPELNASYEFYIETNKLKLRINNNHPLTLFPTDGQVVWNGKHMCWIGFGEIKFEVRENNEVNAFEIGDARVKGVRFEREE